jgi:hypothetical protein
LHIILGRNESESRQPVPAGRVAITMQKMLVFASQKQGASNEKS